MSRAAEGFRKTVIERVLHGRATTPGDERRAAFDNLPGSSLREPARALVAKVAKNAWKVTDADVAAVKAAGVAEDAIFEYVIAAALGQASRQLASATAALDEAFGEDT